ncbi:Patatin [Niabella ginsenosidivorans]|uniref:Patatin n=1 Tax=Niabella ginsenosidivorans TaxID=1176587 RepID=A0A1A9HZ67_9BACT|nr:patatin-like phospholipase family protein [Niabella ginsenosidivorans]ANH79614.1 Patatin [Niabella ginsenosidivorans]
MNKALIISGGGSKGAFAVGVIKDLVTTYQLNFDTVVGTSTGSLIAPLAAMQQLNTLEHLYTSFTTDDLIEKYNIGARLNQSSLFTANGLGARVKEIYTDDFYASLINAGKKIYLTSTCLQSQELVVFTTDPNPAAGGYYTVQKIQNADHFRRAIMASASQPVFMPPVQVNKNITGSANPDYQFVDGGVREYAGMGIALDAGATELFTILLSAKNSVPDNVQYTNLFSILLQTVDIFITDVSTNDLYGPKQFISFINYINEARQSMKSAGVPEQAIKNYFSNQNPAYKNLLDRSSIKWHIIQPDHPLGGGPGGLEFDPAEMKNMLATGAITAAAYVASLKPGDVDWA